MIWKRLVDYDEPISRGHILRLPAMQPYESVVDFLVVDIPEKDAGLSLVVASGYKSGLLVGMLPEESYSTLGMMIDPKWLTKNWAKWVYPETPVSKVMISPGRPAPRLPLKPRT